MKKIAAGVLASVFFLAADLHSVEIEAGLFTGYRQDGLNWSIAGPNNTPNVLSELTWRDLHIYELGGSAKLHFCNCTVIKAEGDFGWIQSGDVQDSDYAGFCRTNEFSRAIGDSNGDCVYDGSMGMGFPYPIDTCQVSITPMIGVAVHGQNLRFTNGVQVLDLIPPSQLGPIPGLNSTYRANWLGPWAGFDFTYNPNPCLNYWLNIQGEFASYYQGSGHWNLRDDFVDDFKHKAWGYGITFKTGFDYYFNGSFCGCSLCGWAIGADFTLRSFHTNKGRHRVTLLVDQLGPDDQFIGTIPTLVTTRLNGVNWHSWGVGGHIKYAF